MDALGMPPSGCRPGVSLKWDLPAGEMSRMALGGVGLEVDPDVVWKSQSRLPHRASSVRRMRLTGRRSDGTTSSSLSASTTCERR